MLSVAACLHVGELATNEDDKLADLDVSHPVIMPWTPRPAFMWLQQRALPVYLYGQVHLLQFCDLFAHDLGTDVPQRRIANFITCLGGIDRVFDERATAFSQSL